MSWNPALGFSPLTVHRLLPELSANTSMTIAQVVHNLSPGSSTLKSLPAYPSSLAFFGSYRSHLASSIGPSTSSSRSPGLPRLVS